MIVVKPLTLTTKHAQSLIRLAKKNNLYAVVDFHKRYDLTNLKIYDIINSKKLGDLLHIHVEYSQQKKSQEMSFDHGQKKLVFFNI